MGRFFLTNPTTQQVVDLQGLEGRRWHRSLQAWSLPPSWRAAKALAAIGLAPLNADTHTYLSHLERYSLGDYSLEAAYAPSLVGSRTPMQFQKEGMGFLRGLDSALLYDEQGLGKTLQGTGWAQDEETLLIICPKAVLDHWEQYAKDIGQKPWMQPHKLMAGQWGITNYERLNALGHIPLDAALVVDEVHYIKNLKTRRAKAVHRIAKDAARVLALSGTPMINRPIELWSTYVLLQQRHGGEFFPFAEAYCDAYQNSWGWDFSGASRLDELKDDMLHFAIRRTKALVLPQLPPKRQETIYVKLQGAAVRTVREAEQGVVQAVAGRTLFASDGLAKLQRLRIESALGKVGDVAEWLQNHLDSGGRGVACFGGFHDPLNALAQKVPGVFYTGEQSDAEKARSKHAFMAGDAKVMYLTYGAGGVGLDGLQESCDTVVLLDLPWTPAEVTQAEDRVHRMGQSNPVTVYTFLTNSNVERMVMTALEKKLDVLTYLMEGL